MKIINTKVLGFIISVFFIIFIVQQVNIKDSFESFRHINGSFLILIIPISYLSFFIRAVRWKVLLSYDNALRIRSLISTLFIGYAANCTLPAKMGEIYRAYLFGKKEGINCIKVFASIVLERVFDGTVLFVILLSLIQIYYSKPWISKLTTIVGSVFIGSLIFIICVSKYEKGINTPVSIILIKQSESYCF